MMVIKRAKLACRVTIPALVVTGAVLFTGTAGAAVETVSGPDVSSWQHVNGTLIDWAKVKAAGQAFAMVKATEGLNYINPYFVPDIVAMRLAGVATGTYHYADVTEPAAAQAAIFAATTLVNQGPMDLPPVIDFEDAKGRSPQQLIAWLHSYLGTVQSLTGRTPIIYTYPNFWRNAMGNTTEFSQYPLWIADYNGKDAPTTPLIGGWKTWTFWQYTSTGHLPGVQGNVDLNKYNTDLGPLSQFTQS